MESDAKDGENVGTARSIAATARQSKLATQDAAKAKDPPTVAALEKELKEKIKERQRPNRVHRGQYRIDRYGNYRWNPEGHDARRDNMDPMEFVFLASRQYFRSPILHLLLLILIALSIEAFVITCKEATKTSDLNPVDCVETWQNANWTGCLDICPGSVSLDKLPDKFKDDPIPPGFSRLYSNITEEAAHGGRPCLRYLQAPCAVQPRRIRRVAKSADVEPEESCVRSHFVTKCESYDDPKVFYRTVDLAKTFEQGGGGPQLYFVPDVPDESNHLFKDAPNKKMELDKEKYFCNSFTPYSKKTI